MSERHSNEPMMLAPGASRNSGSMRLPGAEDKPSIEDHLVQPETSRNEMVRGKLLEALPARTPHGDMHVRLIHVVEALVAPGYVASADLLTRFGPQSDFATDVCVRRDGIDPATDSRFLEEVCFEIVYTQRMSDMTRRAQDVIQCGVRRMFAICVKGIGTGEATLLDAAATRVLEWSQARDGWIALGRHDVIEDACFVRPLAVHALLDAAAVADEVVRALHAKGNRAIQDIHEQSFRDGRNEGLRDGRNEGLRDGRAEGAQLQLQRLIAQRIERLGLALSDAQRARLAACTDLATLESWLDRVLDGEIPQSLSSHR